MDQSQWAKKPRCVNGRTLLDAQDSGARSDIEAIKLDLETLSNDYFGEVYDAPGSANLFARLATLCNDFHVLVASESTLWFEQNIIDTAISDEIVYTQCNQALKNAGFSNRFVTLESRWSGNTLVAPTVQTYTIAPLNGLLTLDATVSVDYILPAHPYNVLTSGIGSEARPFSIIRAMQVNTGNLYTHPVE